MAFLQWTEVIKFQYFSLPDFSLFGVYLFNELQISTTVQVILPNTTEPVFIKCQITYVTVLQDIRERTAARVRAN